MRESRLARWTRAGLSQRDKPHHRGSFNNLSCLIFPCVVCDALSGLGMLFWLITWAFARCSLQPRLSHGGLSALNYRRYCSSLLTLHHSIRPSAKFVKIREIPVWFPKNPIKPAFLRAKNFRYVFMRLDSFCPTPPAMLKGKK